MAKPVAKAPAAAAPALNVPATAVKLNQAFSIERAPGGWVMVTLKYDPATGQTAGVERTQPDLKAITIEKFKITSFKYWSAAG